MKNEINNFFLVIEGLIDSVRSINSTRYEENYKRIVLFSHIDMMSKAVYGDRFNNQRNSHRNKFTTFISEFCRWTDGNRISLQQLLLLLNKYPSERHLELKDRVEYLISRWPRSQPVLLSYDPFYEELVTYWRENYKINGRITLEYFKHLNLFYSLRNSYVHENRPLGYSFELFSETKPHYISRGVVRRDEDGNGVNSPHEAFELMHPTAFYFQLIETALPRMKNYCNENSINPYDNFRFGTEWIDV